MYAQKYFKISHEPPNEKKQKKVFIEGKKKIHTMRPA